jgi:rubredoxin
MKMLNKADIPESPSSEEYEKEEEFPVCYLRPGERLREGMICPRCHAGKMAYNGMLNLVCSNCGLTEAGACT